MAKSTTSPVSIETPASGMTSRLSSSFAMSLSAITETAAIAASCWRGRGNDHAADAAAVNAMREGLNSLDIAGTVVIGEGERAEAPMLYIGEQVGTGSGPEVDLALDPLECTTVCAKNLPDSLTLVAIGQRGAFLHAPDVYMEKIAIGPGFPDGIIDLDRPAGENIAALARAKGGTAQEITACILDRPRHRELISEVRRSGAVIKLIGDGDVAGIIHATDPVGTGIDIYIGTGGAPEGILAAAALRATGGQMQGRLILDNREQLRRAKGMGIKNPARIYSHHELAAGDVVFAATGVTNGSLLSGVRLASGRVHTETMVMESATKTLYRIRASRCEREFAHLLRCE